MDRHVSMRGDTKSNLVTKEGSGEEDEESDGENDYDEPQSPSLAGASRKAKQPKIDENSKASASIASMSTKGKAMRDQVESYAWKSIGDVFAKKNKSNEQKQSKDAEAIFGEMVAEELRQFKGRAKAIVRHRIHNVIFEEQMKVYDEATPTPTKVARSSSRLTNLSPQSQVYPAGANYYGSQIYHSMNNSANSEEGGSSSFSFPHLNDGNGQ